MKKQSRLIFTEEERADPTLEKPIEKSEKAADKVEKAKAKIPKKTIKTKERTFDAETGKAKVRLHFEEVDKPKPPSKLEHNMKKAPQRAVLSAVHEEISKDEQDNVGLEAAHGTEKAGEFTVHRVQSAYHSHKLKPYRTLAKAEKKSVKADVNVLYKKSIRDNPQAASNPISRFQQKREIKKQYIATRYGKGAKTAQTAKSTVKKGADAVSKAGAAIAKNPKVLLVIAALFLLIAVIAGAVSSCSVLFQGAMSSVVSTSYTSENEELIATNDDYTALETALQAQIDNIERDYPDYDEYRYDLATIGHDPHQLASYLTALLQYFKASEVQGELRRVFENQYKLTLTETVEVRYRTETRTDSEGNSYTVEVPYEDFATEIKSKTGKQIDTSTLDRELKNYEGKLREVDLNKTRLENEIDSLPEDTRFRERKLHDMTLRLDSLYDIIVELEEKIEDVKLRRKAVEQDAITLENIYTLLANFEKVYDKISDEEKKSLISSLIKEIEIFPCDESELPLKSILFNFPVYKDGGDVYEFLWDKSTHVSACCVLQFLFS